MKGVDPRMYAGLASHCTQQYAGSFEIVFGVSSLDDPAVGEIERLQAEFPECAIRLVECRERLGTSGKVSNLVQMLREARYEHVIDQRQRYLCLSCLFEAGDGVFFGCAGGDGDGALYRPDGGGRAGDDGVGAAGGAGDFDGLSAWGAGGADGSKAVSALGLGRRWR